MELCNHLPANPDVLTVIPINIPKNFFGRLKVEMFYGEKFESVNAFIDELKKYIYYYNNERISLKLKGMSSV